MRLDVNKRQQLCNKSHSRWFPAPPFFFCAPAAAISLILHSAFPALLCCSRALQLRRGRTYYADLSQNSSKAFKTFSWEVKYKGGDPAGYTSNVISVLHTTERRGAAHASQLMAGTPSFRRLVSPESVRLMKPAKQWIQCEMWLAVGHGRVCEGLSRSGPVKSQVFTHDQFCFSFFNQSGSINVTSVWH